MRILKTILLGHIILCGLLMGGCKATDNLNTEEQKLPQEVKALLWKISGNGLAQASYLFGTIHMIEASDFFLPEGTLTAMDQTTKVIFEIDMTELNEPMKLMPLMQKAFMKGDTTLADLMTEEDYQLTKDHFSKMGLPLFFLERIKPMFLTVFASGDFDPTGLKSGKMKSYEVEFASMAESAGKQIGGLETIEYQISIFDSVPYKDQADMLIDAIKASDTESNMFQDMVDLYKTQDIDGLYQMMQGDETVEEYEDVLLIDRNQNWIPLMVQEIQEQPTFFAVGAGHLGGSKGVLSLLRQAGYSVEGITE